jgi:hypothetical protein
MSKNKDDNSWKYGGIKKRDYNQSHDGPEEMPHKKKKKKINRSKCKHDYQVLREYVWPSWHRLKDAVYTDFACSKCGKKKMEGPVYR